MKMLKKDLIALIIIMMFVIGINYITDKIMKDAVFEIRYIAKEIEEELEEKINVNKIKELDEKWNNKEKMLSYFSEHDELEKVTKEVKSLIISADNESKEEIKEEIEQINFLLSHIEEKNKLKLKNIF